MSADRPLALAGLLAALLLPACGPDSPGAWPGDAGAGGESSPDDPDPADPGADQGAGGSGGAVPDLPGWTLTWHDEFDGPAGTSPDPARWRPQIGGDGWGNDQLEFDTDRPENAGLDGDGKLVITARREPYQGRAYTSARLSTQGLFSQTHGRFEARLKMPVGAGLWPAFWLLGDDLETVGWPACGEIDIVEYRGQEPSFVIGSIHGPGYSGADNIGKRQPVSRTNLSEDFHRYAIEWSADRIRYFIDDLAYHEVTPANLPPGAKWVYDHDFFILLNLAVGGSFVGPVGLDVDFPQTLTVDYVRVYAAEAP